MLDQPVVTAIVAVLVLGPVIEEIMFRGWLTGTWRALIGTVAVLAVFYMGPRVTKNVMDAPFLALQFGFLAFGLTIFWALASRRTSSPINGFERLFPLMFWGQGAVFGMLHFRNLYSDTIILPLLMSLPLVVCGWLWGYARVAIGLPAALVLHMAYNVPSAVGMVVFIAMAT